MGKTPVFQCYETNTMKTSYLIGMIISSLLCENLKLLCNITSHEINDPQSFVQTISTRNKESTSCPPQLNWTEQINWNDFHHLFS